MSGAGTVTAPPGPPPGPPAGPPSAARPGPPASHSGRSHSKPDEARRPSGGGGGGPQDRHRVPLLADQSANSLRRQTPFLCALRFRNELPEVPCDPKMLFPPVQADRLAAYSLTSLEAELRHDLAVLPDLGVPVSVLDAAQRYGVPDQPGPLHPDDLALVEGVEDIRGPADGPRRAKAKRLDGDLSWLMRTSYISNDFTSPAAKRAAGMAAVGGGNAAGTRRQQELDVLQEITDRDAQVAAIQATFDAAGKPPVHPKNPALRPVEVLPLLPSFGCGGYEFVDAQFEDDPTQEQQQLAGASQEVRNWASENSLLTYRLTSVSNETLDYVAHLLPRNAADPDRRKAAASGTSEYESYDYSREYAYRVRHEERGKTYLLAFQEPPSSSSATHPSAPSGAAPPAAAAAGKEGSQEDPMGGEVGAGQTGNLQIGYDGPCVGYLELAARLELRKPGPDGRRQLEQDTEVPQEFRLYKRKLLSSEVEGQAKRMRDWLGWDDGVVEEVLERLPVAHPEEEAALLGQDGDEEQDAAGGGEEEEEEEGRGGRRWRRAAGGGGVEEEERRGFAAAAAALEDDEEDDF